jgi:hypothetical protein
MICKPRGIVLVKESFLRKRKTAAWISTARYSRTQACFTADADLHWITAGMNMGARNPRRYLPLS